MPTATMGIGPAFGDDASDLIGYMPCDCDSCWEDRLEWFTIRFPDPLGWYCPVSFPAPHAERVGLANGRIRILYPEIATPMHLDCISRNWDRCVFTEEIRRQLREGLLFVPGLDGAIPLSAGPELATCSNCDLRDLRSTMEDVRGVGFLCADCVEGRSVHCERCRSVVAEDDSIYCDHTERTLCSDCFDSTHDACCDCGDPVHIDVSITVDGGSSVCEDCYDSNYFTCDECEGVFHSEDYGSNGRCQECESCHLVRGYSEDVLDCLTFLGKPGKDGLYYGVELEVNSRRIEEHAQETIDRLGSDFCILKEDSSISSGGFEIVTAPSTMAIHRERWARFFDGGAPHGMTSWKSGECGLHVHVSRRPLSQLAIGKILVFINADRNRSFIGRIAGRQSSTYAKLARKKVSDVRHGSWDRYEAINTQNGNTIEFRIFRGTVNPDRFMANLEFVAACVAFCRQAGIQELTQGAFLAWIGKTPKVYPALAKQLREWGYLAPPKARPAPIAS